MPIENESFYEIALNEIESNNYSRGLWAKCFSEAMGVESVTKAIYIKYRVEQLQQEFNANQSKPLKDTIGGENIDSRTKWNCPFCRNSNTFNNTAICSICRQSNPDLESHGEIVNSNLDSDCLNRQSSSGPHPWHRWFARVLDHYFFSFPITMALVKIVPIHVSHYTYNGMSFAYSDTLDYIGFFTIPIWLVFESFLIFFFGATPGKFLFGISLVSKTEEPLTISRCFFRSIHLYLFGLFLAIPRLNWIPGFINFRRISRGEDTSWDIAENIKQEYTRIGPIKGLIIAMPAKGG